MFHFEMMVKNIGFRYLNEIHSICEAPKEFIIFTHEPYNISDSSKVSNLKNNKTSPISLKKHFLRELGKSSFTNISWFNLFFFYILIYSL